MATAQKRKPKRPPKRARRSLLARPVALPSIQLEAHHVDIIGLALIAVGIFFGGVAYLHWAGGPVGDGALHAAQFVVGALGYAVPAALVAGGALILIRELRPPPRPPRTGLGCLGAAPAPRRPRRSGIRRASRHVGECWARPSCGRAPTCSRRSGRTSWRSSCS